MSIELHSPAGRMIIDAAGRVLFERDGRVVLQSAPAPAFLLLYGIELPAQGLQTVEQAGERATIHYATSDPRFIITLEVSPVASGFRLHWSVPGTSDLAAVGVAWSLQPQV